ncbi:MAG: NUDIX hydrolase [Oscillochloris sp.]|nr:NUDIX hydrolase [Oscillochloris sp.]
MSPKPWKTLSSRPIYENPWINLREDVAELPNGRTTIYGVVSVNECVGVLPFIDNERVLMVRQYRYVFDEIDRWEIPSGGLHTGETPETGAQRELREEVGYAAGRLHQVSSFYTSKSIIHETAHIYLGYDLIPATLPADETEEFEIAAIPFTDVLDMVVGVAIRDSLTVNAVLHAAHLRMTGR